MTPRNTDEEYRRALQHCRDVYVSKAGDYGPTWRMMRPSTLTDQMYIKACRIRRLETAQAHVDEGIYGEFVSLVNYGLMALIQLQQPATTVIDMTDAEALRLYDAEVHDTFTLMTAKNHDYDEAWRDMRISSFTDIILTKLQRIKKIEEHAGRTAVSEGAEGNYRDIVNYALFAIIRLDEERQA